MHCSSFPGFWQPAFRKRQSLSSARATLSRHSWVALDRFAVCKKPDRIVILKCGFRVRICISQFSGKTEGGCRYEACEIKKRCFTVGSWLSFESVADRHNRKSGLDISVHSHTKIPSSSPRWDDFVLPVYSRFLFGCLLEGEPELFKDVCTWRTLRGPSPLPHRTRTTTGPGGDRLSQRSGTRSCQIGPASRFRAGNL